MEYQIAEEHKTALSLVGGLPLRNVKEGKLDIRTLRESVQNEVAERVHESLVKVKAPFPDTLDAMGPVLRKFAPYRPMEWCPDGASLAIAAPSPEPVEGGSLPARRSSRRRPPHLQGDFEAVDLFEPCPEGEARLARELEQSKQEGAHTWWSKGEWLGKLFAFWLSMNTRRCDAVAITLTNEVYDANRFDAQDVDAPKDKATIIEAPSFFGDNPEKEITCGKTNWGLAYEWGKSHGDELLAHPSRPSIFGISGRPVFPGIAGVHTLVQTSDGYVLFGLRAPEIAFHERTWSATFEEQVSVGSREFTGPVEGDKTLLHVIEGGLYEEWGIEEDAITISSCLAIGREWGRDRYRGQPMLNLSSTVIAACRLNISLADVWASLDETPAIEDIDEHRAWAGIRFSAREDVLRFTARAKGRGDNDNLLEELCAQPDIDAELALYPRGTCADIRDRGLMPTAAARLLLASGWFETLEEH